jgi:aspartate aminotransferase
MVSIRNRQVQEVLAPIRRYDSIYFPALERAGAAACDFSFGNPHDMPLAGLVAALQRNAVPENKDWFAYKMNEAEPQRHLAAALQQRLGIAYCPEDICLTNGATGALNIAFSALLDPGDEVIINMPPFFLYEAYIMACGGVTVKVNVKADDFDLDIEAIRQAITPKTRAVLVNSPHNPTGKIYGPATLTALAALLQEASRQQGHPIYMISDEAFSRILFDGRRFISPTGFYPYSMLVYTYGKTLLAPGQRLGYLALSPEMPGREEMRRALTASQVVNGWAFPSALMQSSIPELEGLCVDLDALQFKRDWMMRELRGMGYQMTTPEGTLYLLVKSPLADDLAFATILMEHNVFCLPGSVEEAPGYFRVSLTANEDMIKRALPGFRAAIEQVQTVTVPGARA